MVTSLAIQKKFLQTFMSMNGTTRMPLKAEFINIKCILLSLQMMVRICHRILLLTPQDHLQFRNVYQIVPELLVVTPMDAVDFVVMELVERRTTV
jgi:hypothetical protein